MPLDEQGASFDLFHSFVSIKRSARHFKIEQLWSYSKKEAQNDTKTIGAFVILIVYPLDQLAHQLTLTF